MLPVFSKRAASDNEMWLLAFLVFPIVLILMNDCQSLYDA